MQISVIIPAYNSEKWVSRAIQSVLDQTVRPAEIIVVDDGSTDKTAEVVKKYDDVIRYIRQKNTGPSAARNRGIAEAKYEWIAFLDSDDEWFPNWISKHQYLLDNYKDCLWSACNFEYSSVDSHSTVKNGNQFSPRLVNYFSSQMRDYRFQTSGFLIHRSVFKKVGMFNTSLSRGEDLDLWTRIAFRFPKIGYIPEICYRLWIDNTDSLTRTKHSRTPQLKNICDNIVLAKSIGQDTLNQYYPYARKRALSYIFRAAAKKLELEQNTLKEAKETFPLKFKESMLEKALKILPSSIAGKVVNRFVD